MNDDGQPVPFDEDITFQWGKTKFFSVDTWKRSENDKDFNTYWETQSK